MKIAQQLEPKLYDGNVKYAYEMQIVIPRLLRNETLLPLAEESCSRMFLKQQDPMMLEKKVNITPVDYAVLNQLSQDFETQFVPQTKLSAEQAFWSQNSVNSPEPTLSSRPTKVKVPKELPKVSMVNMSLKKLKHHPCWCLKLETELLNKKDFVKKEIYALKDELRKLKGKDLANNVVTKNTIAPEMLKIDVEPIAPKLLNNRKAHYDYLRHTQKQAATLREVVEQGKTQNPLNNSLGSACKKPRKTKTNVPVSKPKIIKSIPANNKEPSKSWGSIVSDVPSPSLDECRSSKLFSGTVKLKNGHVAKILGYGDYQIGNVTISRVYYVEGLGHNLFSVGQFCYSNLDVAFRQHICFIRNLEGVDLLTGSRGNNLYTLSLRYMMASSPICLLSKASKTKSWLWHRRPSHLNFGAINHLARHGLVRGLLKLKFEKDHLCSACAMGKSKKKPHKPKYEDTNHEKLYLLHMDLCGPMRVASVNGNKYILVIVDDYSQFTWVKCLRSKDEALDFIIKRIIKKTHVDFDELTAMASEHSSLEPVLHEMTPATISSGLVPNPPPSTPFVPPSRTDWDLLFQLLFDELLNPSSSFDHPALEVIAPIAEVVAPKPAALTGSPSSTTIDQDAPSPSISQTTPETHSPVISNDVEKENHNLDVAHTNNNPFFGILIPENDYETSSS
ncbi:retrovirus-related pol polyprotein from transposon TNT 1-94 [Tanacetum coccineum]|uniref:Retrovirus-related pol polyprotein from transposon TNT 1-94 n=1 Tax=Tanacetum coccineum TaxID=301880 RepID=A0ABQ4WU28_9ASTR